MLTERVGRRARHPLAVMSVAVAAVLLLACGSDGGDAGTPDDATPESSVASESPVSPESSVASESSVSPASSVAASAASVASASSGAPDSSAGPASTPEPLAGVTGELIITRQRDLLDRGLINVQFRNDSDLVMEMTDRQLLADHFATDPAAPRTSLIPNGRPVNLQVPYGTVTDCESTTPVGATLEFTYTTDADGAPARGVVPLSGTELLDTIRAEQCAQVAVDTTYDLGFDEPVVDGEQLTVDLVVEPVTDDSPSIVIERGDGTILVDATLPVTPVPVTGDAVRTPVVFAVIRCDPHAMAEVTKRYGLELSVAIDGAASQPVDVDVTSLGEGLDEIVANCRQRTASES